MSSGQKAVYEDGEDWNDLQKAYGISGQKWQLYSREHDYAKQGIKLGFKQGYLIDFVILCLKRDKQKEQESAEAKERAEYERLHRKYGNESKNCNPAG